MSERFGRYTLLEPIGNGGMAEVFRAKSRSDGLRRIVAIKRIHASLSVDPQFVDMFIDEANVAAGLNHTNIAQVFDFGRVGNQYYIAIEHIHGRDFRTLVRGFAAENAHLPVAAACHLIEKVCAGLDYAHERTDPSGRPIDLVHRDISLQNLLLSFDGEVKIIDFGVAKAVGRLSRTQAGFVKGKFAYMSPEQIRGLPLDARSDIFSCGIVLWELLTSRRLFASQLTIDTLRKVRDAVVPRPSSINPHVPRELDEIVLKALSKHVEDRYQSARELGDALQACAKKSGHTMRRSELADWVRGRFPEEFASETMRIAEHWQRRDDPGPGADQLRACASPGAYQLQVCAGSTDHVEVDESLEVSFVFGPAAPAVAPDRSPEEDSVIITFDDEPAATECPHVSTLIGIAMPARPVRPPARVAGESGLCAAQLEPAAAEAEDESATVEFLRANPSLMLAAPPRWARLVAVAALVLAIAGGAYVLLGDSTSAAAVLDVSRR